MLAWQAQKNSYYKSWAPFTQGRRRQEKSPGNATSLSATRQAAGHGAARSRKGQTILALRQSSWGKPFLTVRRGHWKSSASVCYTEDLGYFCHTAPTLTPPAPGTATLLLRPPLSGCAGAELTPGPRKRFHGAAATLKGRVTPPGRAGRPRAAPHRPQARSAPPAAGRETTTPSMPRGRIRGGPARLTAS